MDLKEIKNIFHRELDAFYAKEEVDSFFYMMVEHYLGMPRFVLALQPNTIITKEREQPLFEGLAQLRQFRPIQYVLGKAHFMDMEFRVDERVLIPRPETEELIRWILDEIPSDATPNILDIGTGSGCIAIALAKNVPGAHVYALDISGPALALATQNAKDNGVSVVFMEEDILNTGSLPLKFNIIVSNPPYVRLLEKGQMAPNVLQYEPESALFVDDEDPLLFYREIATFSGQHLLPGGALYVEINQYLGEGTAQLFRTKNLLEVELRKDMFGNDRMLKGTIR
ncbi:MAG: peptide chain release factor N(5)-glutamine methyltransferase [Sediminicola sp.]|tara:strand:+ start:25237 stop:26085 length:849 start_codon:yes stop_codon:yes gene_type:complete